MKKKTPAKPAAKKAAPAAKLRKPAKAVPSQIASSTPEPHKPGVHLPSKPAPAYAQMQQRAWAHKPPPHKLRFNK